MSSQDSDFKNTVETLFSGMESFLTSKTVVGTPVTVGDTIILPLVNVSFGVGAGVFEREKSNNGGGGLGGKMTPNAVIIVQDGNARLVRIDDESGLNKLIDMVPGVISKFTDLGVKKSGQSGKSSSKTSGSESKTETDSDFMDD